MSTNNSYSGSSGANSSSSGGFNFIGLLVAFFIWRSLQHGCAPQPDYSQSEIARAPVPTPVAASVVDQQQGKKYVNRNELQYSSFSKWGLSFEYPNNWKEHPADRVSEMKKAMKSELQTAGISLQELALFAEPSEDSVLFVMKYTIPTALTPKEFIEQRNQKYDEAKKTGDVTKVNGVAETVVANMPAIVEDVERSNGGRGRTYKILDGKTVYEVTFVVSDAKKFTKYSASIDHIVTSIKLFKE